MEQQVNFYSELNIILVGKVKAKIKNKDTYYVIDKIFNKIIKIKPETK